MGDTSPTTRPALAWGVSTDPGRVRTENEDNYVAEPMVLGIADGMGGHLAGEVASQLAVDVLRERLGAGAANLDVVVAAVAEANAAIFSAAHANADQRGMGTTLTAIALIREPDDDVWGADAEQLVLVNVGDSRAYVHRDGVLRRASIDHSYVQELVATGHITEAEARTHPRRNIVTRALGIEPQVRVDTWTLRLVKGDRYVLCSDGLVDEVDDAEIQDVLNRNEDPQEAAEELVAIANVHGGRDNVTVVVVDVLAGADPWELRATPVDTDETEAETPSDTDDEVEGGPEEVGVSSPLTADDPVGDPAATGTTTMVVTGGAPTDAEKRRRMTPRMFVVLIVIAAAVIGGVVALALALGGSDEQPSPTTVTTSVPSSEPVTTTAASTTTTAAPTTTIAVSTTAAGPSSSSATGG